MILTGNLEEAADMDAAEVQSMYSETSRRFSERLSVIPRMNSMPTMPLTRVRT